MSHVAKTRPVRQSTKKEIYFWTIISRVVCGLWFLLFLLSLITELDPNNRPFQCITVEASVSHLPLCMDSGFCTGNLNP